MHITHLSGRGLFYFPRRTVRRQSGDAGSDGSSTFTFLWDRSLASSGCYMVSGESAATRDLERHESFSKPKLRSDVDEWTSGFFQRHRLTAESAPRQHWLSCDTTHCHLGSHGHGRAGRHPCRHQEGTCEQGHPKHDPSPWALCRVCSRAA